MKNFMPFISLVAYIIFSLSLTPVFFDAYIFTKWCLLYFGISSLLLYLIINNQVVIFLPKLDRRDIAFLLAISSIFILCQLISDVRDFANVVLDKIVFVILTFIGFDLAKRHGKNFLIFMAIMTFSGALVSSFVGITAYLFPPSNGSIYFNLNSFFGNQNIAANYVCIGLIGGLLLTAILKTKIQRICLMALMGMMFSYVVVLASRSAMIAILATAFYWLLIKKDFKYYFLSIIILVFSFITVGPPVSKFFGYKTISTQIENLDKSLINKINIVKLKAEPRLVVWKATYELIKDFPLGVGVGRYENAITPYLPRNHNNIKKTYHSPHNEYLRILAEEGILYGFMLFFFGMIILFRWLKTLESKMVHNSYVVAIIIFFTIQCFFQFPLYFAPSFLIIAFLVGYILSCLYKEQIVIKENRLLRNSICICFAYLAIAGSTISYVKYAEKNSSAPSMLRLACNILPSNYSVCFKKARQEIKHLKIRSAHYTVKRIVSNHPNNLNALKNLGNLSLLIGDKETACVSLRHFLQLAIDNSVKKDLQKSCPQNQLSYK